MSRDHIPGFPHKMPQVNWDDNLPVFQGEKFDDPLLHLIKFHIHVWRLKVEWHEDCLMKMFMLTLEGKARGWYEWLRTGSLFSLRDLHMKFYDHYKENSPYLLLEGSCCNQSEGLIEYLAGIYEDLGNWQPEDLVAAIHEFHTQDNYHKNLDESIEEEINQGTEEIPQDIPAIMNNDSSSLIAEAQEDIQPQNQSSQGTEN